MKQVPKFGVRSMENLVGVDERLRRVCLDAIEVMDFSVISGYRTFKQQREVFLAGRSRLDWPNSLHNKQPALAVDLAPYPIDWEDTSRFHELYGVMIATAFRLGIKLRWGGRWTRFRDFSHYELAT